MFLAIFEIVFVPIKREKKKCYDQKIVIITNIGCYIIFTRIILRL